MRRVFWASAIASAMVLLAASLAFAGGSSEKSAPSAKSGATTIQFWSYTTGEEQKIFQNAIDSFNATHSKIHVVPTFGVDNQKFLTATAGGSPPDAADVNGSRATSRR